MRILALSDTALKSKTSNGTMLADFKCMQPSSEMFCRKLARCYRNVTDVMAG